VSTHPTGSSPDTWPGLSDPPDGSPLERGHAEVERQRLEVDAPQFNTRPP
jgi:hypothetical protein